MPQSLAQVYLHIVFSMKDRLPYFATADLRNRLSAYIVGALDHQGSPSLATNSVEDHLHCLCRLSRSIAIADLAREIKVSSSKWLKDQHPRLSDFHWQAGYGVFSVSQSKIQAVKNYIANQEKHHRKVTFQDEYRRILERHGVTWDERYVWD